MLEYLKVKANSLAAEAKIIRRDEKKMAKWAKKARDAKEKERAAQVREGLHNHRAYQVRHEARATHLARGYLNGLSYTDIECWTYSLPDFERVLRLVLKYGDDDPRVAAQVIAEWEDASRQIVARANEQGRQRNIARRSNAEVRKERHAERKSEWLNWNERINVDIESDHFPVGL